MLPESYEAVDRRDVGMVEGGEHLRFSAEPCDAITIKREGVRQDLQRDIAIELGVARAIDLARAPFAEQGHDFVRADASAGVSATETAGIIGDAVISGD